MTPRYGTPEWREWRAKLVAEAYELLTRAYKVRWLAKHDRKYDTAFAVKK